jgi:hypothetical protein
MRRSPAAAILLAAGIAAAQADPVIAKIEKQLPPGWSLLATDTEVVIRHDRPTYVKGRSEGPLLTLELRYKLEPKWSAQQVADARAKNDKIDAELRATRGKLRIEAIKVVAGKPQPKDADERGRLAAYEKAEARTRHVRLPRCAIGAASLFDSDDTYSALALDIDPPEAKAEAKQVIAIVDRECPSS